MENPQTSNLKNREVVKGLPFYDVDYCMYSDWGYKKRTRIWTNKPDWNNLLCDGSGACGNMIVVDTNGAVRHDTGKPLKCDKRTLHKMNCGKSEQSKFVGKLQHKNVLANGYEYIDGKKVLCNTKEKRDQLRKHKKNVAIDVHTIGEKKGKTNYNNNTNKLDRYRVPEDLIFSLFLE